MNNFTGWCFKHRFTSRDRAFFKMAAGAALSLLILSSAAIPLVTVALPTQTRNPNQPGAPTPTFTPTPVVRAVEATPTSETSGALWQGIISSDTERQYKHNGATLNTCDTYWKTQFGVVIDPAGNVHGAGEADLVNPAKCTPHPISGNSEKLILSVAGKADDKALYLTFSTTGYSPNPSADFGGFDSLILTAVCQRALRTLTVPFIYPDQANLEGTFTASMAGCAGSAGDLMTSNDHIVLDLAGDCAALPADVQAQPVAKLCG